MRVLLYPIFVAFSAVSVAAGFVVLTGIFVCGLPTAAASSAAGVAAAIASLLSTHAFHGDWRRLIDLFICWSIDGRYAMVWSVLRQLHKADPHPLVRQLATELVRHVSTEVQFPAQQKRSPSRDLGSSASVPPQHRQVRQ